MTKRATSIDEQLALLKQRGLIIGDEDVAREILSVIGYYRLGFYLFPFELSYPALYNRTHEYQPESDFLDAVRLYYFDLELRNMFLKYIFSIEVYFRSVLVHEGSMTYRNDPLWFVNSYCVSEEFLSEFDRVVYNNAFRRNPTIKRHHKNYRFDKYAPAWKTLELMTFGENIILYNSLLDRNLRRKISERFGVRYIEIFENYIEVVRILRNACAHGSVMFDFKPFTRIKKGPAGLNKPAEYMNIYGCLKVVRYLLRNVAIEREALMAHEIEDLLNRYSEYSRLTEILYRCSGFPKND